MFGPKTGMIVILVIGSVLIFCALLTVLLYVYSSNDVQLASEVVDEKPIVNIESGPVLGTTMVSESGRDFFAFLGVPYAKPPVGKLRFQPPEESEKWNETFDATVDGPPCPQLNVFNGYQYEGSENCLTLNVFSKEVNPSTYFPFDHRKAVMVYFHGGYFYSGSSSSKTYGPQLLVDYDVIIVTVNYRLGPLGFLSTGDSVVPGNMGLKDQVMALKWVQKNIAAFGGDPKKVTIFGEGAGAGSTHLMQLSPLAKGLFQRVISQSGSALCFWCDVTNTSENTLKLAEALSCPTNTSEEMLNCLQQKDAHEISSNGMTSTWTWHTYPLVPFGPVVEKESPQAFMTENPKDSILNGNYEQVPWLVGFDEDEGASLAEEVLSKPYKLKELLAKRDTIFPVLLYYSSQYQNLTEEIYQFYFHDRNNSEKLLVNLLSDRMFTYCVYKSILYQMNYSSVYFYQLNYRAQSSFPTRFTNNKTADEYGPSHFGDVMYLFNSDLFSLHKNTKEKDLSNSMLALWTNFAKLGTPTPFVPAPNFLNWQPVKDPIRMNHVVLEPHPYISTSMEEFERRFKFWRKMEQKYNI